MKLFICGQREFGAEVLRSLRDDGHQIVGVAAPPPGPDSHDALYGAARAHGCKIIPAGTLRASNLPEGTDLVVAAFCHDFIGQKTRNKTKWGGIGYHPSLLPRHRGRDAVEWTIRMRDPITGGTVYWLSNECDGGDIAAQEHCFVRPDDTAKSLYRRDLFPIGIRLLRKVVADIGRGVLNREPQLTDVATWEPTITKYPVFKPELPELPYDGDPRTFIKYNDRDPAESEMRAGICLAWNKALAE